MEQQLGFLITQNVVV